MNTRLSPTDSFPEDLSVLDDLDLQVHHSRVQRQLDHEYAYESDAHPETAFRHAELLEELDRRDGSASAWRSLLQRMTGEGASLDRTAAGMNPVLDPAVFGHLVDDLGSYPVALDFVETFDSLLGGRITRIGQALEDRDEDETVTALLSLQASASMAGAVQLEALATRALVHQPVGMTPQGSLMRQLESEAAQFRNALTGFRNLRVPHIA